MKTPKEILEARSKKGSEFLGFNAPKEEILTNQDKLTLVEKAEDALIRCYGGEPIDFMRGVAMDMSVSQFKFLVKELRQSGWWVGCIPSERGVEGRYVIMDPDWVPFYPRKKIIDEFIFDLKSIAQLSDDESNKAQDEGLIHRSADLKIKATYAREFAKYFESKLEQENP